MITTEQARTLQQASDASYDQIPSLAGHTCVNTLTDPKTGFNAVIFKKDGTNEYIIAFTGTEPQTSQDVVADLAPGTTQWKDNATKVRAALTTLDSRGATKISFTGHSLGGAHAQYGAYRYLAQGGSAAVKGVRNAYHFNKTSGQEVIGQQGFCRRLGDSIMAHFESSGRRPTKEVWTENQYGVPRIPIYNE
ncbi:lipase family protein [Syntrophorhabdus aromaticivorans]|jgi:hypothetical protein|uniref:Fungal lipase-like domain-containing protein n=1 Tax=Syntrophorhabdus aromaticivorans TaxID=328301 RepID=A0A971M395_9BACT|nr:hypothetical protein [Syntrophorhabdus aromaticivorans]NLW34830.1 hypothetical protein [Syntrophorhabdus aromaticivorans]